VRVSVLLLGFADQFHKSSHITPDATAHTFKVPNDPASIKRILLAHWAAALKRISFRLKILNVIGKQGRVISGHGRIGHFILIVVGPG